MAAPLSDKAKWLFIALFTLFALAMLAALAEGGMRLRHWMKYGAWGDYDSLYFTDEKLDLRVLAPGKQVGTIRINSLGFRGPEIPVARPERGLRLAFLGASTTYCAEVSGNEKTWPHLVTQRLASVYPAISWDYVNGAAPGYVVRSSLTNLRHRVARLKPDIIVIYHATNDMSGETRELAARQGIYRMEQIQSGRLARYSLLWSLVEKNARVLQAQHTAMQAKLEFDPQRLGDGFRRDLTELVREAQKAAPLVAIATFSQQIRAGQNPEQQLKAAASALYYMPFMTPQNLLAAYSRYNQVIREVARDTGALLIEGEMDIPGDNTHFNDTVHFKDAGSALMARRVTDALLNSPAFLVLAKGNATP